MNTRPVPGENKQVLASKDKPEYSDYEKELSAQQESDKAFHNEMEQEVANQEKKDKEFHKQMEQEVSD